MKIIVLASSFLLAFVSFNFGQTTIAIQDFDGGMPTMAYTGGTNASGNGDFPSTAKYVSASNGRQVNNSTTNITFATVNTTGYTNINFSVQLASFAGTSGNGADGGDYVFISVSTDGGVTWSQELEINGNNNAKWGFSSGIGVATVAYDGNGSPVTFAPTGGGNRITDGYTDLSVSNLPASANLRIRMEVKNNSNNELWVIDDAKIEGTIACVPPTITSITPISGPENTIVTINATSGGLTGATAVTFDGLTASYTILSDFAIEATVPTGATTGNIVVTDAASCDATYSSFTVVNDDITGCQGGTAYGDLFISEVYDANSGDCFFYEIYNGTGSSVNLGNYRIVVFNNSGGPAGGAGNIINLTNTTLASGSTWLIGQNATCPAIAVDQTVSIFGINDDDGVALQTSSGTVIDQWGQTTGNFHGGGTGYVYRRIYNAANVPQNSTSWAWNASEWTYLNTETTADLGLFSGPTANPPTVTSHPTMGPTCLASSTVLTVAATEGVTGGLGLAYQWHVASSGASNWSVINNGGVYSGATTASLNISSLVGLANYQYYCEVRENTATCYKVSDAVQINIFGLGGTSGLWTGEDDNDWCNCLNWDDGIVPTTATNVTINQTAYDHCNVESGCSALAASVSLSSNSGTNNNLYINNGGILAIGGALTITKTTGGGTLITELTNNGTLQVSSITLAGTAVSSNNAVLRNESATALLDIDDHLTISTGGLLDLNANGIMLLAGDYTNNHNIGGFDETNSTVVFNKSNNQTISTSGFAEEFHHVTIDKTGGIVTLQDPISLDATGILNLTNDQLSLNGNELSILNTSLSSITRISGGSIIDESGAGTGNNNGKITWVANAVTGARVFPFASGIGGTYIPFTFNLTAGNAGAVSLSTYGTGANNLPWPSAPNNVIQFTSSIGLTPDNRAASADRFWQIDATGTPVADITFSYASGELPALPYNTPTSMVAQRYNTSIDQWEPPISGVGGTISGGYEFTISGISTFSPWVLSSLSSPLPVELVSFNAIPKSSSVDLEWITASEQNVDYFVVERSSNGIDFSPLFTKKAVGNSSSTIVYNDVDTYPLNGVSYYRLKIVDQNDAIDYSLVRRVIFNGNGTGLSVLNLDNTWKIEYDQADQAVEIRLLNAMGQLVEVLSCSKGEPISILNRDLSRGVYFLSIKDGNSILSQKLYK